MLIPARIDPAEFAAVDHDHEGVYAELDENGKVITTALPAIAISETSVVNSQATMLEIDAEVGDIAVRTDLNKCFILAAPGADTLGNWQELLTPPDTIASVDGRTGVVTLSDLYASATDARLTDARTPTAHKTSHATGGTDALTASDIGAASSSHNHDSTYAAKSTAFVTVSHGSTAGTARPTGIGAVYWIGSVEPTNAINGDQWYDTTGDS
jgi:hypothetical protein